MLGIAQNNSIWTGSTENMKRFIKEAFIGKVLLILSKYRNQML
jgi:hypothetical protein